MNSPRTLLYLAYGLSVLLFIYFAMMGAGLTPERPLNGYVQLFLMPIALVLWARSERPVVGRTVAGLHGGIWFLIFGILLVPYYLFQTRRRHSRTTSVLVMLALFSPSFGAAAGLVGGVLLEIPRQYYQLVEGGPFIKLTDEVAIELIDRDFRRLTELVEHDVRTGRGIPIDLDALYERWYAMRPNHLVPIDPYTGDIYYYGRTDSAFALWSTGPDRAIDTDDDLTFEWTMPTPHGL